MLIFFHHSFTSLLPLLLLACSQSRPLTVNEVNDNDLGSDSLLLQSNTGFAAQCAREVHYGGTSLKRGYWRGLWFKDTIIVEKNLSGSPGRECSFDRRGSQFRSLKTLAWWETTGEDLAVWKTKETLKSEKNVVKKKMLVLAMTHSMEAADASSFLFDYFFSLKT